MPCLGAVLLVGWMVSDLRWTANEVRQATVTSGRLRHHAQGELPALGVDGPVWQFVRRIRQTIKSSEPARILLIRDPTREEFYALRAKYFLLPNSVALRPALRNGLDVQGLDYVLFLGAFRPQTLPPDAPVSQALRIGDLPMSPAWRDQLKLVMADPEGLLFLVPHHPRTAK